jgi:molecular chaperone GrpE
VTEQVNVSDTTKEEAQPNGAATASEKTESDLAQELDKAKQQAAEYLDLAQRARAELANFRRRADAERATLTMSANARLLTRILPVLDDFERAFETLPAELRNLTWIQGVAQIYRKLQLGVEAEGATPIDAVGKPFDPKIHDAIMQEESHEYADGVVSAELQRGYMLGERVLRPTLVKVSSGPGPKPQVADADAADAEETTQAAETNM